MLYLNYLLFIGFFRKTKLDNILNKVNFINLVDFDTEELYELYSNEDIEEYKKILNENQKIVEKEKSIDIEDIIITTLNQLEHMCMYISTKVADEKYIYNSLHQQFLKSIALLYISISLVNTDNKDKYYMNIVHVYNLWKNKYIKVTKKENKFKKKQKKKKKKLLLPVPKV